MPILKCLWCDRTRSVEFKNYYDQDPAYDKIYQDRFLLTVKCRYDGKKTTYELQGNAVEGVPTRLISGELDAAVTKEVQGLVDEATDCFSAHACRGVVALCRAAVEQALEEKNAKGRDLKRKIEVAHSCTPQILGDQQVSQCHAARIDGNDALHDAKGFSQSQGVLAIVSCIDVVNHIAMQPALP